jgi:hypothetical protein
MHAKPILVRGILLVAGVAFGSVSAPVWAQGYLGVSAGLYQPEDKEQDRTRVFDVRGGYRIRPAFGFEWSVSRVNLVDTVPFQRDPLTPGFDFDQLNLQWYLTNFDLSLQWFPKGGDFVIFGGPGVALVDAKLNATLLGVTSSKSYASNIFTSHAGVAYVWPVKEHFFVRPEARVRRYFGYKVAEPDRVERFHFSYKATDYAASLTFGWRFGSAVR